MSADAPKSLVMHGAARHYDLLASLLTFGRERALRERLVDAARLVPGERVLDVGCGTGSLALAAKRRVGPGGTVHGVDASPEMIAQARGQAARARADVTFEQARAESLPIPDASVDVVLSTLMMHHLPRPVREAFAAEIRRVLAPGGRVLVADFEPPARRGGLVSRLHRHGHVPLRDIVDLLGRARLRVTETGAVGVADLQFALATKPAGTEPGEPAPPVYRTFPPLPLPAWPLALIVAVVVAAHLAMLRAGLALGALATVGGIIAVALHLGAAGGIHSFGKRHRRRP